MRKFDAAPEQYATMNAVSAPVPGVRGARRGTRQRGAAELERMSLAVTRMTYAGCARTVESALSRVAGVHRAIINLATETATVEIVTGEVDRAVLTRAVQAADYGVREEKALGEEAPEDPVETNLRGACRRLVLAWALTGPVAALMILHMSRVVMIPYFGWAEVLLARPCHGHSAVARDLHQDQTEPFWGVRL